MDGISRGALYINKRLRSSVSRNLFVIERKKREDRGDCDTKSAKDEIIRVANNGNKVAHDGREEFAGDGREKKKHFSLIFLPQKIMNNL